MKLGIIVGSSRNDSQSGKVARFIAETWKTSVQTESTIIDLRNNPLPLWDESIWSGNTEWQTLWEPIQKTLQSCDAFVFVVPEWGEWLLLH